VASLWFAAGVICFRIFNRHFYDALQNYKPRLAIHFAMRYLMLVGTFAFFAAVSAYVGNTLLNRWRRWLTRYSLDRWLDRQAFYRMPLYDKSVDNPDQRICDDIDQFTSLTLSLFNGFYATLIQLITFTIVLWHLSGVFHLSVAHWHFAIPGYLVWCALVYSIVSTGITFVIGRTLSRLNYQQQHFTADFRFGLMRVRENSEAIAMMHGEQCEKNRLISSYQAIYNNFTRLIMVGCHLTFFTKVVDYVSLMVGVLFALPKFMVEKMSVGDLMQISSAFGYVVSGFSFFMDAYTSIASWLAVVDRLTEFSINIEQTDHEPMRGFVLTNSLEPSLLVQQLHLSTPSGQTLIKDFTQTIQVGERVLIMGVVGCGKSTLFRTIVGLWPFATGLMQKPQGRWFVLSQKPYFPIDTLQAALSFPQEHFSIEAITYVFSQLQLSRYVPMLKQSAHWMQTLSLGEQQMLGFARAILLKPDWLLLDEASSSLDEANETFIYQLLFTLLPKTTVISIGHRSSLIKLHDRVITL
jgi:putative ATP-binding cassette transporter